MRIKPALIYRFEEYKKVVMFYYVVIVIVYTFLLVTTRDSGLVVTNINSGSTSTVLISGIEISGFIFLFVLGLNSFTEPFKMFLQNSISRVTVFTSFVVAAICTALGISFINSIINLLLSGVERYSTIFQLIYGHRYISYSSIIPSYFEELLWSSFLYISVLVLGFLIATLYYRLSKVLKYVVSIGVPVFFLMILPILDTTLAEGNIYKTIITFMLFIFGKTTNGFNPYYTIISSLAISIILFVISYLLLRRATIKD